MTESSTAPATGTMKAVSPGGSGIGMPAHLHLERFGYWVCQAYGHMPYLVGSATLTYGWRDVDVRLILPDDEFAAMFGAHHAVDAAWTLTCAALSALGHQLTGLPIDFQIQPMTRANTIVGHRVPLGMVILRDSGGTPDEH